MMYHFIFGLWAGSPPGTASAAAAGWPSSFGPAPTATLSFFSLFKLVFELVSVSGIHRFFRPRLTAREIMQHPLQAVADRQIHQPEIKRKEEHGDDHHRRRRLDFLARRRRDFLHLCPNIVVKRPDALRPGPQTGYNRILFYRCRHTFPLSSTASSRTSTLPSALPLTLAGAEGFEPPSSVLETDSLTVELTPLELLTHCH